MTHNETADHSPTAELLATRGEVRAVLREHFKGDIPSATAAAIASGRAQVVESEA